MTDIETEIQTARQKISRGSPYFKRGWQKRIGALRTQDLKRETDSNPVIEGEKR